MIRSILTLLLVTLSLSHAGVYDTLEFGDSRETVTKKLQASELVEQNIDDTFFGRTGLNGVFKCKTKLAGLTYHLYFDWNDNDGLHEITLRSNEIAMSNFDASLKDAWKEANKLFTQVYGKPVQDAGYPRKDQFNGHSVLITHMWHKGNNHSILIGPASDKGKCFLIIRFLNEQLKPMRTP